MLRSLRSRYIVHAHAAEDALFHPWVPRAAKRALLWGIGGSQCFVALTQFWADYYSKVLNSHATQVVVLSNPVEIPPDIPDRRNRNGLRLLFLGRIGNRKGAFDIIKAFADLPQDLRNQCSLTLAGDGESEAARTLAANLHCSTQISIPGWVDRDEVSRLLAESDILLLPSRGEGMANALLEGMAWGLAVITTAAGGAAEFLRPGIDAILVEPGDTCAIRAAISGLAADPALRARLGLAARETARQFAIELYVQRLTQLYESLSLMGAVPGGRSLGGRSA
jgi:glycosyltransferase involved in cell wall biosynthesis